MVSKEGNKAPQMMCDEQGSVPNIFSQVKSVYSCSCAIKSAFTRITITFALERNKCNPKIFVCIYPEYVYSDT